MTADPFDAAGIRQRVLAAWTASPARFREDANAEEDLAGGYRDRLVVELAQNAADAAARAGVAGRLLLRLVSGGPGADGPVLVAANTGTPLDAAGVSALATLRASAKRDGATIGRFGVGFAAVLAVTDEPAVISRTGGVRFSRADTLALVRGADSSSGLADELVRRNGHAPVLRLPFPAEASVPEGYDTVVVLPLRDPAAVEEARRRLDQVDDGLLLALPALAGIRVEIDGEPPRELADVEARWRVLRREGDLAPELLATRPTEERGRARWQVTWALPATGEPLDVPGSVPAVVHAPTPCEEPLPWPAVLVATLPLEPSRRHVAPGPVADAVIRHAAAAYVELLAELTAGGVPGWPLVVSGLPAGAVDGALRAELDRLLPAAPVLIGVEDGAPVRPRDAATVGGAAGSDDAVLAALAPRLAGLVPAPRAARALFRRLGVPELDLADVIEALPEGPPGDPGRWLALYAALDPLAVDPLVREALARLPVPLAGGSPTAVARGVRGLLLPGDPSGEGDPAVARALARLGARVVDPRAAHPLLERLGARVAGPRALVELDAVRAAVDASRDDEPGLVEAVLQLVDAAVRAGELAPGDLPWLADLALPDEDGEPAPAGALALPGSPAADWFDPEEIGLLDAALLDRWGAPTLAAVGVLRGPAPLRAVDVRLGEPGEPEPGLDGLDGLDGWDDWCEFVLGLLDEPRAVVPELLAVRDLDAVSADALPAVVAAIAADPVLRPALTGRCRVIAGPVAGPVAGSVSGPVAGPVVADVLPYTAWWLRQRLAGSGLGAVAATGAGDGLAGLLPPAAGWLGTLDGAAQAALGVIGSLADIDVTAATAVVDRLADPSLEVAPAVLLGLLGRLAALARAGLRWPAPPPVVRGLGLRSGRTEVVDADDAVVLDAPMYLQRADLGVVLPAPPASAPDLADLFDLPLAVEVVAGAVAETGSVRQPTPPAVRQLLPGAPATWCEHDELRVDGAVVDWWVTPAGAVHAATVAGLARGLAWAGGSWSSRAVVEQLLTDPESAPAVLLEAVF